MNILIDAPLSDEFIRQIQELSPHLRLTFNPEGQPLDEAALREAEVLYALEPTFPMEAAPKLRWLQANSAAVNQFAGQPILESDVTITNVSGAYTTAVAECALAMLLAVTRKIPLAISLQEKHEWDSVPMQGEDLYGKTLGIIGYGSIGRQIARIASAMGMKILACKRQPQERASTGYALPGTGDSEGVLPEEWYGIENIHQMLPLCDVVLVTLPLSTHTHNLIGAREMAAMKPGSILVNVGRGGVIDESALLTCLQQGHIAGAALDVFEKEPLPADSPMWDAPNLLALPHVASWSVSQPVRAAEVFVENLRRYLAGEPLRNVIDKHWMY